MIGWNHCEGKEVDSSHDRNREYGAGKRSLLFSECVQRCDRDEWRSRPCGSGRRGLEVGFVLFVPDMLLSVWLYRSSRQWDVGYGHHVRLPRHLVRKNGFERFFR